jgi:quercetin dioxygenase-like cupin family protein
MRKPQRFAVSHARDAAFDGGLRRYAKYRDLGFAAATDGLVQAHVIRFVPPFRPEEASTPHFHEVDFQMVYVLKGWYRTEFEGEGVHTFEAGSCWIQPPGIRHAVLGYSDDCELLEIVLPADFATVTVDRL